LIFSEQKLKYAVLAAAKAAKEHGVAESTPSRGNKKQGRIKPSEEP